jgi:hypothetical protein
LFIRETIALVLAVCCIYLYISAKSSGHPVAYRTLAIICLIETVLAHHLTAFMLFLFLLIHFFVSNANKLPFLRRNYFGDNTSGEKITSSFLLISFVAIVSYWVYVATSPVYSLSTFVKEIFATSQWGVSSYGTVEGITTGLPQFFRGYVLFYGFYFFLFIFVIILLYGILPRPKYQRIEALSFTVLLFLSGIGGLTSFYITAKDILPNPTRFLTFGWLFAFGPLVAIILGRKNKWLVGVGIFLLFAFMLHNIYQIDPQVWDAKVQGAPEATTEENYALANTLDFSSGAIAADDENLMAIYDVHNILGSDAFGNIDLSKYNWVIIDKQILQLYNNESKTEAILEMEQLEDMGSANRDKIYQSDNMSVFQMSG